MEEGGHVLEIVTAIVTLLVVAAITRVVATRIRTPYTVALVVVGILLAEAGNLGLGFLEPITGLEISPELVFLVFLPVLVFESAFNLDARALRDNLVPVLALAVPGLLLSTGVIGGVLVLGAPLVGAELTWLQALLLGSILSATDPVAVIALFRQLGAPKRLTVLVEGESLFNDATAIVLSRLLLGFIVGGGVAAAGGLGPALVGGGVEFLRVFCGGILAGWALGLGIGTILGRVEGDAFIEISLTTILAYLSFLVAEELLHVSGVMAVVTAGILIGGWGKAKISPSVAGYLEHFWEYMAAVANSLIFLLVGLRVELAALAESLGMLAWVVAAMLVSRALVVYLLVPLVGRVSEPVDLRYQTVMFWGGLRGAVALAIALSLPALPGGDPELFVALVTGAVLFTLVVQGLTIERLMKRFGLDEPPLADRVARIEGRISAAARALEQVPELESGGLFSARIAETVRARSEEDAERSRAELDALRARELLEDEERKLLYIRCLGMENKLYYRMFSSGHLSERAYRDLAHSIELQTEAMRHRGRLLEHTLHPPDGERLENTLHRVLERTLRLRRLAEWLRRARTTRDYEVAWGRQRGSQLLLSDLEALDPRAVPPRLVDEVRRHYRRWHDDARTRLDQMAEQFPEFVGATQQRLADRLVLHAEREAIEEKGRAGILPRGVAEAMLEQVDHRLRRLRASRTRDLHVEPAELLRKVPFFRDLPPDEAGRVAALLRGRTAPAGDLIVRQGSTGDSLYLVARGVVRVSLEDGGPVRDLATLLPGDFFGEMALLRGGRRTATCRAVTPCALYELRREDVDTILHVCPAMRASLERADRERSAALAASGLAGGSA